jgi:hypothetical protein
MKLTVHFVADPLRPECGHLLMRQERVGLAARELDSLPLTARERDVLALVAVRYRVQSPHHFLRWRLVFLYVSRKGIENG